MVANLLGVVPLLSRHFHSLPIPGALIYYAWQMLGSLLFLAGCLTLSSLLTLGLSVKLGLVPFHFWVPPLIAGSPWFLGALMTT